MTKFIGTPPPDGDLITTCGVWQIWERPGKEGWRNFKLIRLVRGPKSNYWLAHNNERMKSNYDLTVLLVHHPEIIEIIDRSGPCQPKLSRKNQGRKGLKMSEILSGFINRLRLIIAANTKGVVRLIPDFGHMFLLLNSLELAAELTAIGAIILTNKTIN